eukprot:TRINITY_DN664_c3_g1_i1.p1 TRINITY_DN664_c3_g1~~TRINITY_DN664_c3_g1_i1.p1  ORF type:complete len:303 (+),score=99.11 TRINITY_DN664_c3_g1_i1:163-1071(+)
MLRSFLRRIPKINTYCINNNSNIFKYSMFMINGKSNLLKTEGILRNGRKMKIENGMNNTKSIVTLNFNDNIVLNRYSMIKEINEQTEILRKKKKKGGKGKDKGGGKAAKIDLDPEVEKLIKLDSIGEKMDNAIENFSNKLLSIRASRPSTAIVEQMPIEVDNSKTTIGSLCTVTILDGRTLGVFVPEEKYISPVTDAIIKEGKGEYSPIPHNNQPNALKVPFPKMSQEYRETLIKSVSTNAESSKEILRKIRKQGMDAIKKNKKSLTKDDIHILEAKVQDLTDQHIDEISKRQKAKIEDLKK